VKVRCLTIINRVTGGVVSESSWVTIGSEYTVLAVSATPDHRFSVRLDLGDKAPVLWDSEMFETTDPIIPSVWVARFSPGGSLQLAPPRWLERGFWERYFDNETDAVAVFEEDRRRILGEQEGV